MVCRERKITLGQRGMMREIGRIMSCGLDRRGYFGYLMRLFFQGTHKDEEL